MQNNMRNNAFTSNLENAKMLADMTKERVNGLNLEATNGSGEGGKA